MAKAPESPRRSSRRRRGTVPAKASSAGTSSGKTKSGKSTVGRIASLVIGVGATAGVMAGLNPPVAETPVICGGSMINRWDVKVANDPTAMHGQLDLDPGNDVHSVADMNDVKPGPLSPDGRMDVEKKAYTVHGFLSFYKMETGKDGDRDYHVVIADSPGDYVESGPNASGHSMVVEFPNPSCFGGKHDTLPHVSALKQQITEARATFEDHVKGISPDEKITQQVPVTLTGIPFFDKAPKGHQPTGHSRIWPDAKGKPVVLELHPVTEITFDNDPDID